MSWKNFVKCGLTGWCLEILFTAAGSLFEGNFLLMGETSLWMFPIYGMTVLLIPVYKHIYNLPLILRGIIYGILIHCGEFLTGSLLQFFHVCPWDYSGKLLAIHGVIRLDYFPYWFAVGLMYEQILCESPAKPPECSFLNGQQAKPRPSPAYSQSCSGNGFGANRNLCQYHGKKDKPTAHKFL